MKNKELYDETIRHEIIPIYEKLKVETKIRLETNHPFVTKDTDGSLHTSMMDHIFLDGQKLTVVYYLSSKDGKLTEQFEYYHYKYYHYKSL